MGYRLRPTRIGITGRVGTVASFMRWKNTGCYLEFTEISSPPPLVGRKIAEAERCRGLESNAAPRLGDAGRIRRSGGSSSPRILSRIFRGFVPIVPSIKRGPLTVAYRESEGEIGGWLFAELRRAQGRSHKGADRKQPESEKEARKHSAGEHRGIP